MGWNGFLGRVGSRFFSFRWVELRWVGWGPLYIAKVLKKLKDYVNACKARLDKFSGPSNNFVI